MSARRGRRAAGGCPEGRPAGWPGIAGAWLAAMLAAMRWRIVVTLWLLLASQAGAGREHALGPGDGLVGEARAVTTRYEDTLAKIAERHGVGYQAIIDANPQVDPWLPGDGAKVHLPLRFVLPPGAREGVVINLAEYRLYYYPPEGDRVITHAVGIGRPCCPTPLGETETVMGLEDPSWTPPASIRAEHAAAGDPLPPGVIPAGPDNPLGRFAVDLAMPGILIHGTNQRFGVGTRVSHGCVRLYEEEVESFVRGVPNGTPVRIVHVPYKTGWHEGRLYLEAHAPLSGYEPEGPSAMVQAVVAASGEDDVIDWDAAEHAAREARGMPVVIGSRGR